MPKPWALTWRTLGALERQGIYVRCESAQGILRNNILNRAGATPRPGAPGWRPCDRPLFFKWTNRSGTRHGKSFRAARRLGNLAHSIRHDHSLTAPAEWIVRIRAERRNALKPAALIEGDGLVLVDSCFEADDAQPM